MPQRQSLTRTEAEARAELVEVDGYEVELELDEQSRHFRSRTTLTFSSGAGSTFVEIRPVRLASVALDGEAIDVSVLRHGRLPLVLAPGRHELVVDAHVAYRSDGQGKAPCQRFARNCATRSLTPPLNPTLDSAFHLLGCVGR